MLNLLAACMLMVLSHQPTVSHQKDKPAVNHPAQAPEEKVYPALVLEDNEIIVRSGN